MPDDRQNARQPDQSLNPYDRLVENGNDAMCLDNFFTGARNNISHLLEKSNFVLIRNHLSAPAPG